MSETVSIFTNKPFEISLITEVNLASVETLVAACEGICELGFRIKVMPKGDQTWQEACFDLAQKYPDNFLVYEAVASNQELALGKSQVLLCTEVPAAADLKLAQKKGLIVMLPWPACEVHKDLSNFDAQQESGNCFLYTPEHTWDLVANMVRAFENYKFSYDWSQLKKRWKEAKV